MWILWRDDTDGRLKTFYRMLNNEPEESPVAPPSPDYIPGTEDLHTPPVPQDEDERARHLLHFDSPTAESPGYIAESDPEEYEDDETEDGPVDYPMDGGDDEDDDDGDSFRDDADDEDEGRRGGGGGAPLARRLRSQGSLFGSGFISLPPEVEVERLLAKPTPSPSPPISLSPPSAGERLARCMAPSAHSPPPVPSPLLPSYGCPTQIQTLRMASTQAPIYAVTAALPSPPLPPLPPSLYIPPPVDRRDDLPESELPPRKRLCLSTLGSSYEAGESFTARPTEGRGIDYGFVSTVDAEARRQRIREVNTRVTELAELHERDTQDLYALLEDAQDETVWVVEEEAYASREAWAHSIGLSQEVHHELQTHCDHVYVHETRIQAHQAQLQPQSTLIQTQHQVHETRSQIQQTKMAELRDTDRRHKEQMVEIIRVMRDMRRKMGDMQAELLALRGQQRARQPRPDARILDHQDASGDADSHI
ncbi:hypothetical protein Tco_1208537 [Tanacetum coccineum]